jgi:hypothetical protein
MEFCLQLFFIGVVILKAFPVLWFVPDKNEVCVNRRLVTQRLFEDPFFILSLIPPVLLPHPLLLIQILLVILAIVLHHSFLFCFTKLLCFVSSSAPPAGFFIRLLL